MPSDSAEAGKDALSQVILEYKELFSKFLDGGVATGRAPVPEGPEAGANNLKASAYFLDAVIAGCCEIRLDDWTTAENLGHRHVFVFVLEFEREPKPDEPGVLWLPGANLVR